VIPLSVLDLATVATGSSPARALRETTMMAISAERFGCPRFWVTEHHAMPAVASSAPAVLMAHLANATSTLRIGTGGVMLPNHSPLVIAEQFAPLEALHPGRIDLGLGRAPGTDHITARALRRTGDLHASRFPDDVVELIGYPLPREGPVHPSLVPGSGYLPQVWLLGSSTFGAQLAGARAAILLRLALRARTEATAFTFVTVRWHSPAFSAVRCRSTVEGLSRTTSATYARPVTPLLEQTLSWG
jgi:luciferase family oxidoreductase group 1